MLIGSAVVHILGGMPGIDRRNTISGELFIGIFGHLDESSARIDISYCNLLDGIADAVAHIFGAMLVARVGRFCHEHSYIACGD